ncbi:uncharacterized protein LOC107615672 [Arachis ipaensis]|uniref:uncharacterized protein LOC107615672 n=1 Tax=Arachis ipaensis TaxID=130454 RepID=UPI0007AF0CD8|nr:uncharacterized protein LOC107615672 [Arachis ipaensis]
MKKLLKREDWLNRRQKLDEADPKSKKRNEKLVMWEELSYVAGLCQVPCRFMGDFNEIVQVEERRGTDRLTPSAEDFKNWIHDMGLVDLPITNQWLEEFSETRLRGGPRGLSDHYPIIVEDKPLRHEPRPFRRLDSWFTHEGSLRMVREEWRGLGDVQFTDKLKALTIPLGRWHKANFGDMDKKILKFEEEIKKIDDMVGEGIYDGTMEARRRALVACCEKWNQARNKIVIRNFYKDLYHQEESPMVGFKDGLVEMISEEDALALEMQPTTEEVREAVWDCESSKALESDGYNMNFIKKCWDEIGPKITAMVFDFFQSSRLPADANLT